MNDNFNNALEELDANIKGLEESAQGLEALAKWACDEIARLRCYSGATPMKNNNHGCYEDYCHEIDEEAERKAHEAEQCEGEPFCVHCLEQRDIEDMAEHVNKELEKE